MQTGNFKLSLADFTFVPGYKNGRLLRCSLTWRFESDDNKDFGAVVEGCLVVRGPDGRLTFNTPMVSFSRGKKRLLILTPDLAQELVDAVSNSRYAKYIGEELPDVYASKKPEDLEKDLPEEITA